MFMGYPFTMSSQTEYSFAIGNRSIYGATTQATDIDQNNLVKFEGDGNTGLIKQNEDKNHDHYYHSEKQPAYTSSHLLSGHPFSRLCGCKQ